MNEERQDLAAPIAEIDINSGCRALPFLYSFATELKSFFISLFLLNLFTAKLIFKIEAWINPL